MELLEFAPITVLLAEDDPTALSLVARKLRNNGYKVLDAKNGKEAWQIYQSHKPDIIITDLEMPILDGISLAKNIRHVDCLTPIIIITAHQENHTLVDLINTQVNHYISKPFRAEHLLEIVEKFTSKERALALKRILSYPLLSKKELHLLQTLAAQPDMLIDHTIIEHTVWPDKPATTAAIKSMIKKLRGKIGKRTIECRYGQGYILHPHLAELKE